MFQTTNQHISSYILSYNETNGTRPTPIPFFNSPTAQRISIPGDLSIAQVAHVKLNGRITRRLRQP